MTCIVGLVHAGKVYMGADSAGVAGLDIVVRNDKKIFKNGPFLMGFTSSFRMGQLLAYKLKVPKRKPRQDILEFMVVKFIDAVRTTLLKGGYTQVKDSRESGGCFLVGYAGRLFKVESDFQVAESSYGFDSCGCGESYALAVLKETEKLAPEIRLKKALAMAEFFSAGVRGPFFFEKL